jgi:DNA-binding SARP family transcriptional activator
MLIVDLLGPPRVTLDGTPIEVDTRKAIAILGYLVVEGSATRDTLAGLFWAESPQERARATLRRTLSSIRGSAGADLIDADRNLVRLVGEVSSDIDRFNQEVEETREHGHDPQDVCARCIPPLTRATALYRGDFLQGFAVQASPEFDDWVRSVAESTRIRVGECFNRLSTAHAAKGEYQAAIEAVTKWIELDPLHEPAYRTLMLLHAWAGDRPGAVEAFRRCIAVLDTELGVPPLEETTELHEAILDEDLPPAPGMRRRVRAQAVPVTDGGELLDREEELGRFPALLDQTRTTGGVVALTGAAWMGKTRLLEELEKEADKAGHKVLIGRAFRQEQALPFGVAAQLFRSAAPIVEGSEASLSEWAVLEVSRLVPELARSGHSSEVRDPFGELRLFDGAFTLLTELAAESPLVVMVDDAQWMDPASAGLVSYVARRIAGSRLLLVAAARSGEPLPELVKELLADAGTQLSLGPLTVEQLTPVAGSQDAAERLLERTGGVPLLVMEAIAEPAADDEEPPGMSRYMESRLRDVSDLSRQVLAAAAVLSGICDASLLRETSGRTEEEVVEAVEELIGSGLLREIGGGDRLGFPLEALGQLTYESTSQVRRRLLHRRAATALEERHNSTTDPRVAAAIAAQHEGAGDPEAAEWYRSAAELSRTVYAHSEARALYEKAIALGHPDVAGIHLALGEIAMIAGDYGEAIAELNTSAARAEGPTLAIAENRLGEAQRLLGRFEVAEEHFTRSAEAEPTYALYADWALLKHRLGDLDGASRFAAMAMELAGGGATSGQLSRVHNIIGVVTQDPAEAAEHLDTALQLADEDDLLRLAALNNKAHLTAEGGDVEGAIDMVSEAIGIAQRTGNRHREAALHDHLADLHHRAGREDEAQTALTRAVSLFSGIGTGDWHPEVWLLSRW